MATGERLAVEAKPRSRLTEEQRRMHGRDLAMSSDDRHAATRKAREVHVSDSWLRTLRRRETKQRFPGPAGRPRIPDEERARVRALVAAERKIQGSAKGWRDIFQALRAAHPGISRMIVEKELAALKLQDRTEERKAKEAAREGLEVLGRDTIWGEDTTHAGRDETGKEIAVEHVRDRATLHTVALTAGPPPTAEDVVALLRRSALERGGWPLLLQVDPASIYASGIVRRELEAQRVVILRSRVHTPTDNPATEHAHREVKDESGLGKGVVLTGPAEAQGRLERARHVLDDGCRRISRGGYTASALDQMVPRGDAHVDRDGFYAAACAAVREAVRGLEQPRAVRKAERDAIIKTLCEFGLARVHRGPRPRAGSIPMPFQPMTCGTNCAGRLD